MLGTELVFSRDGKSLLHFRIDRAEVCIGSHPTNDLVVPDPSVPEIAALLVDLGKGRYRLRDLTGGLLKVNDKALDGDTHDLRLNDTIQMPPYALALVSRTNLPSEIPFKRTRVMEKDEEEIDPAHVTFEERRFQIRPKDTFNVGGHDDNDLVLEDDFVSAFHCRITSQDGGWFLVDLDSTNGTQMNGLRVKESELPAKSIIKLGKFTLHFERKETREESQSAIDIGRYHGMIGDSAPMRRTFELIVRLAGSQEPILILGESGTGKELVARAIHEDSHQSDGPFLALNCSALSSSLIESELFGHTKGAFTGALSDKEGAFEATSGGTLFLDEIGELPLDLQPKLLRVLESRSVRRVGDTREIPISTRIVAATHRNLEELVREGKFREDLFHRLFVLSLRLPPLRERREDILTLAWHFIRNQSTHELTLSEEAGERLGRYSWPGNVRELRNVIVRAILMVDGPTIEASDLEFSEAAFSSASTYARRTLQRHDEAERDQMLEALEQARGNRAEAARILGISKSTFHDRLKRHGIPPKFKRSEE